MDNNKTKLSKKDIEVSALAFIGFFLLLGGVGNSDYRDEMEYENQRLGYEKYDVDAAVNPTVTKIAQWGGIGTLALAAFLGFRKER